MKKILWIALLFTGMVKAQIVNIPDANFKANLIAQGVDANTDGEIQESEAQTRTNLNMNDVNIVDLTGIEAFVNIETLTISESAITTMDFTVLPALKTLTLLDNEQLISLNVSGLQSLENIECGSNQSLSAINFSGLPLLRIFNCYENALTALDFSGLTNLEYIYCYRNQLTAVNLDGLIHLISISCYENSLVTIDLSSLTSLVAMDCRDNVLLTSIFSKNGRVEGMALSNNPSLVYVCADVAQFSEVNSSLNIAGLHNVVVNSYCTFTPGGRYNTISGNIKFDQENNGCDSSDNAVANVRVDINDGTTVGTTFTNEFGNYTFYTPAGNFGLTASVEASTLFNFTPTTANVNFSNSNGNMAAPNFCVTANGIHQNVSVIISPVIYARPGLNATYKLIFTNHGNQTLSGYVAINFNDDVMNFVSASMVPDSNETGVLGWNYVTLAPFESRSIDLAFAINATTDTPSVNIGDELTFTATILPLDGDENPLDNAFEFIQTVVDSEIINDIHCLEGDVVDPSYIGEYLHYVINFSNVGTSAAQNVVIRFQVNPADFDINSLQLINASDAVYIRVVGNVVEFIFQNINLEIGGHGHILLKLRTLDSLLPTDVVSNRANIYFDYNAPVNTRFANTSFQNLSNVDFENENSIAIYPNPTTSIINVKSDATILSAEVYDVQGRNLFAKPIKEKQMAIDLTEQSNGIYFVKITTDKGIQIRKLIKN